jgi:hypothetical protein
MPFSLKKSNMAIIKFRGISYVKKSKICVGNFLVPGDTHSCAQKIVEGEKMSRLA